MVVAWWMWAGSVGALVGSRGFGIFLFVTSIQDSLLPGLSGHSRPSDLGVGHSWRPCWLGASGERGRRALRVGWDGARVRAVVAGWASSWSSLCWWILGVTLLLRFVQFRSRAGPCLGIGLLVLRLVCDHTRCFLRPVQRVDDALRRSVVRWSRRGGVGLPGPLLGVGLHLQPSEPSASRLRIRLGLRVGLGPPAGAARASVW